MPHWSIATAEAGVAVQKCGDIKTEALFNAEVVICLVINHAVRQNELRAATGPPRTRSTGDSVRVKIPGRETSDRKPAPGSEEADRLLLTRGLASRMHLPRVDQFQPPMCRRDPPSFPTSTGHNPMRAAQVTGAPAAEPSIAHRAFLAGLPSLTSSFPEGKSNTNPLAKTN